MLLLPVRCPPVGGGAPVYVIAEAGSNHDRNLDQAKRLIDVDMRPRAAHRYAHVGDVGRLQVGKIVVVVAKEPMPSVSKKLVTAPIGTR